MKINNMKKDQSTVANFNILCIDILYPIGAQRGVHL